MEWESDSPCHSHTHPRQGCRSPGRCRSWQLESRGCGEIPGQGLLLTAERRIEGMWGRRLRWQMPVEESQAAMEAGQYRWITRMGWSHHQSLSLPTCQHWQLNNRKSGPSSTWCTKLQSRLHPGCPFKCLKHQSTAFDPSQGSPSLCWATEQQRRTPGEGAL